MPIIGTVAVRLRQVGCLKFSSARANSPNGLYLKELCVPVTQRQSRFVRSTLSNKLQLRSAKMSTTQHLHSLLLNHLFGTDSLPISEILSSVLIFLNAPKNLSFCTALTPTLQRMCQIDWRSTLIGCSIVLVFFSAHADQALFTLPIDRAADYSPV